MANVIYNSFKKNLFAGGISLTADNIYVALVTSSYSPDIDNHTTFDDINYEIPGIGAYTTGGKPLQGTSVTVDFVNDLSTFTASDLTWTSSSITARGAVLYKNVGVTSNSPLICYIDFGVDKTSQSGDFTIQWNSSGILNLN